MGIAIFSANSIDKEKNILKRKKEGIDIIANVVNIGFFKLRDFVFSSFSPVNFSLILAMYAAIANPIKVRKLNIPNNANFFYPAGLS